MDRLAPESTLFLLCDVQTKFEPAIYGYNHVVTTAIKMIKLAKLLGIEVVATTQNARALGPIDPAVDLQSLGPLFLGTFDKTPFSMLVPSVLEILRARPTLTSVVIFGIETVLALLSFEKPFKVHVVADGVSSCNSFEISIAFARMRQAGAIIGTSESIAFQLMRDASLPNFKSFSALIKEVKESTKIVGESLLQGNINPVQGSEIDVASGGVLVGLKSSM